MKRFIPILLIGLALSVQAQDAILSEKITVERAAQVNLGELEDDLFPQLNYLAAPSPGGDSYRSFLLRKKAEMALKYPKQFNQSDHSSRNGNADEPEVLRNFAGSVFTTGIPLDNTLAYSNGGQIVSAVNSHIGVLNTNGDIEKYSSMALFAQALGIPGGKFDPRVIYDPEQDRFVLTFLNGFDCAQSEIIVGFSETNDAMGNWNLYKIEGCPFDDGNWTDYPMISLTKNEFFLTINLIRPNEPWQTGFEKSIIYQVDKSSGYAGEDLVFRMWSDISYEGKSIRNLHPVKAADEFLQEEMYFLSNRNFDEMNDTIFVLHIDKLQDDPTVSLNIEALTANQVYGAPPNAIQKGSSDDLQTNDARVLDSYILDDQIQFVGNTIDHSSGLAAFYHGIINDVKGNPDIQLNILTDGNTEFGYPGIAWTGLADGETESIIVVSHSSVDRFPGHSAIYYNNEQEYSNFVTVREGESSLDVYPIPDSTFERWGDYIGIQRVYNDPGRIWMASSYTDQFNQNKIWVSEIIKPGFISSTNDPIIENHRIALAPNPAFQDVSVRFEIPQESRQLKFTLVGIDGRLVKEMDYGKPKKEGLAEFHINTVNLPAGTYVLSAFADGQLIASKQLLVQKP